MSATRVCSLSELEQDAAKRVVIDGVAIAVVKDSNGDVHAIGDTCTHGDISLSDGFVEGEGRVRAFIRTCIPSVGARRLLVTIWPPTARLGVVT